MAEAARFATLTWLGRRPERLVSEKMKSEDMAVSWPISERDGNGGSWGFGSKAKPQDPQPLLPHPLVWLQ